MPALWRDVLIVALASSGMRAADVELALPTYGFSPISVRHVRRVAALHGAAFVHPDVKGCAPFAFVLLLVLKLVWHVGHNVGYRIIHATLQELYPHARFSERSVRKALRVAAGWAARLRRCVCGPSPHVLPLPPVCR